MAPQHRMFSRFVGRLSSKYLELALESPYLMLAVVASLGLSIASFYTTYTGMLDFMPNHLIAGLITAGVQVLLLITSWSIGFELAKTPRVPTIDGIIFAICLLTSVFFSFSALFDSIFDESLQQRTRMTRIHGAVETTISDLERMSRDYRKELVETLLQDDRYQAWRENVLGVSRVASGSESKLRNIMRKKADERRREIKRLRDLVSDAAGEKERLKRSVANNEAERKRLAQRRPGVEQRIATLQAQVAQASIATQTKKAEMDVEEKGGGPDGKRKRGRGPVWTRLKKEYDVLKATEDGIRDQLKDAEDKQAALDRKDQQLAGDIVKAQTTLANFDQEMARRRAELEQALKLDPSRGADDRADSGAAVLALNQALNAFDSQADLAAFDRAAALCKDLITEMGKLPGLRDDVAGLSCDRGAMTVLISAINQSTKDLATLEGDCVAGGANAKDVSGMDFETAVAYGRRCLQVSGLPSDKVAHLRGEIARLEREEAPDASQFTKTANALAAGEKLAYFALTLALFMDLLVLFAGVMGARGARGKLIEDLDVDLVVRAHDSPKVKALKGILCHTHPLTGDARGRKYEGVIDIDEIDSDDGRTGVKVTLQELVNQGRAATDKHHRGVYYLQSGVLTQSRKDLKKTLDKEGVMAYRPAGPATGESVPTTRGGDGGHSDRPSAFGTPREVYITPDAAAVPKNHWREPGHPADQVSFGGPDEPEYRPDPEPPRPAYAPSPPAAEQEPVRRRSEQEPQPNQQQSEEELDPLELLMKTRY